MKTVREWISVTVVRSPRLIVVLSIFAANFVFIILAGLLISWLAPPELENNGFWSIVFNTVAMILGVGGTDTVIEDVGQADVFLVLTCLITVIIGLVVFTGTIIGYMSEIIASFIENADKNTRRLHISDHIVILNWNNRAAEIIYEALHKGTREKLVILSGNERDEVLEDINERISDTLDAEKGFKNRLTIIVREGDPGSAKQLSDISIENAKTVVILSEKENVRTIKTLLQVAQTVSENGSAEKQ
jgi:phage shock protein PspC (stress-responsive transcriptional regulator)